ncbi:hypothetical protein [Anabaena azotica]|nr:hypothetical protein [Anabaena azotica]
MTKFRDFRAVEGRILSDRHWQKLLQYPQRVWNIVDGSQEETVN